MNGPISSGLGQYPVVGEASPAEPEQQAVVYGVATMTFEQLAGLRRQLQDEDREYTAEWDQAHRAQGAPDAGVDPLPPYRDLAPVRQLQLEMTSLVESDRPKARELALAMADSEDPDDRAFSCQTVLALLVTAEEGPEAQGHREFNDLCDRFADLMSDPAAGSPIDVEEAAYLAYAEAIDNGSLGVEQGFGIASSLAQIALRARKTLAATHPQPGM